MDVSWLLTRPARRIQVRQEKKGYKKLGEGRMIEMHNINYIPLFNLGDETSSGSSPQELPERDRQPL